MSLNLFNRFFPEHVVAFFSDRSEDFFLPASPPYLTTAQKNYLRKMTGLKNTEIVNIKQTHGTYCLPVTKRSMVEGDVIWEADSVATNIPNIILTIRTADCLPVFIYDSTKRCVALIHAGWKGSQKGIVQNTLDVLREQWGCAAADLIIGFGPHIRACCYEVGEEFKKFFPEDVLIRGNKFYLDLAGANHRFLLEAGVKRENICDCEGCTCCREDLFSYRREGPAAGRHLSAMVLFEPKAICC